MRRRSLLVVGPAWPWLVPSARAAGVDPLVDVLRRGGVAVVMRHAQTDAGVGDPPGFRLAVCSTQRNLSEAGREQARRAGAWFEANGLKPARVRSSAWCRCLDTARIAFGHDAERWPPLNSFFEDRVGEPAQTAELKAELARLQRGRFEVWVTHQVNASALVGESLAASAAVVVGIEGAEVRIRGRRPAA